MLRAGKSDKEIEAFLNGANGNSPELRLRPSSPVQPATSPPVPSAPAPPIVKPLPSVLVSLEFKRNGKILSAQKQQVRDIDQTFGDIQLQFGLSTQNKLPAGLRWYSDGVTMKIYTCWITAKLAAAKNARIQYVECVDDDDWDAVKFSIRNTKAAGDYILKVMLALTFEEEGTQQQATENMDEEPLVRTVNISQ